MNRHNKNVMVSTIAATSGGVPQMAKFVLAMLKSRGYTPIVAYYEPYSLSPELSVPSFRLFQQQPKRRKTYYQDCEAYAIGAWLPELEFTHYESTKLWEDLLDTCEFHISVSGNCLAALPFFQHRKPFLAWVASSWQEDRKNRIKQFPWYRRLLDQTINSQVIKHLEKKIINSGSILALSQYTQQKLTSLSGTKNTINIMPMAIDTDFFSPAADKVVVGRIGFTGRIDDPRKNIKLMLQAFAVLQKNGIKWQLELIGGKPTAELLSTIQVLNLTDRVTIIPYLTHSKLRDHLQQFDVYVLPSFQEGLCISALEAMACGCPVVSTKCGGPEEFVHNEDTGYLVSFDPQELADRIAQIIKDRMLRDRLAHAARKKVLEKYTEVNSQDMFWKTFRSLYPHTSANY